MDSPKTNGDTPSQPTIPLAYSKSWSFYLPNYVLDKSAGLCWTVGINLGNFILFIFATLYLYIIFQMGLWKALQIVLEWPNFSFVDPFLTLKMF